MGADVGQRSETVRRANLSAIVRELHAQGPLSRSELVARTGLTRSAIRSLVGQLVSGGLASEARAPSIGQPGRPSPLVQLNATAAVALGLEIAVDSLAAALVGLGGEVLDRVRVDRERGHSSADEIASDLARLAVRMGWPRSPGSAQVGIGAAVVGLVRRADGFVPLAPNLGWHDVPLGERLGRALCAPAPVFVANDADLGALAERTRGAARGADDVLFISGEVGVGGGLIVAGKPVTGAAGYAGEVGHLPINPAGLVCRCGSVGCWETEVGERALLRAAGRDPDGGGREVDALLAAANTGSSVALEALHGVARWLGIGLAGLVNLFNPVLVVLGGLLGRIYPFVRDAIDRELDRRALPASRRLVRVVPALLGVDAPVLGAAELAFEPLLADPATWLRRGGRIPAAAGA